MGDAEENVSLKPDRRSGESGVRRRVGVPRTEKVCLVVEDDAIYRAAVTRILGQAGILVEAAGDLATGMTRLSEDCFDLVLIDLVLPDGNGIALAEAARRKTPSPAVLVLSGAPERIPPGEAEDVMVVHKADIGENLLALADVAIARATRISRCPPPTPSADPKTTSGAPSLTSREAEIFSLLTRGMSAKEIAGRLGLQEPTVRVHAQRVYRKHGHTSQRELLAALLPPSRTSARK